MKEPWSIKSRARECAASGLAFEDGQKIRAAIFPDPDSSGYLRRDYNLDAWDDLTLEDPPFSTWLTTYHPPIVEEKTEDVVEQDPETLLRTMVEEDEEHTENARYILAVMLERKKLLRETDTQTVPSGILRVYEHRKTGDVFLIKDPGIALADVDRVQEEVRQLLDPEAPSPEDSSEEERSEPENQDGGNQAEEKPEPEETPDVSDPIEPQTESKDQP